MNTKTERVTEMDSEFSRNTVPMNERKSWVSLTIIWAGIVFVITSMTTGGGLAAGMDFKTVLIVSAAGCMFLGIISILNAVMASRTGLTFALLSRYVFGESGSRVATMLSPIINIGWFTVQAAMYGHFISLIFGFGDTGEIICMMLSAIAMGLLALFGMRALTILGYVSIPAIVFLCIAASIRSVGEMGGVEALFAYTPAEPMTLAAGLTAVIGGWINSCSTAIADVMRYAKDAKQAIISTVFGLIVADFFMLTCGAIVGIGMNESDIPTVLLGLGLVVPSIVLMTTNIWTTNGSNLYSVSLCLTNTFKYGREKMIAVCIFISCLAMFFKPYQVYILFTVLETLGVALPPLAGILLSNYYILNKGKYVAYEKASFKKWNPYVWITWIGSVALTYVIPVGFQPVNGLLLSIVIYVCLMKISGFRVVELKN